VCFLWGNVGLGEHLEPMAGRHQPDRLGIVGTEVVSPSHRYGKWCAVAKNRRSSVSTAACWPALIGYRDRRGRLNAEARPTGIQPHDPTPQDPVVTTAYSSHAILLRWGIGPLDQLRQLGISVAAEPPGVGEDPLDHSFLVPGTLRSWAIRPQHAPPPGC
jgi:hypothetical protein